MLLQPLLGLQILLAHRAPKVAVVIDVYARVQEQLASRVVIAAARLAREIVALAREYCLVMGPQVLGEILVVGAQLQAHAARDGGLRPMEAYEMLPQVFLGRPLFAAHLAHALGVGRFVVDLARVLAMQLAVHR